MIINFEFKNYRSYKEECFFTMQRASNLKSMKDSIETNYKDVLSMVAAVYGANASGKSNFLRGLNTVSEMVQGKKMISYTHQQFKLSEKTYKKDTEYRVTFVANDGQKYIYEYHYGSRGVSFEELNVYVTQKPSLLFRRKQKRDSSDFVFGERFTSDSVKNMIIEETEISPRTLLLAVLRGWNEKVTQPAYEYLADGIHFVEAFAYRREYQQMRRRIKDDTEFMYYINKVLPAIDLGVSDVSISKPNDSFIDRVTKILNRNGDPIERSELIDEATSVEFRHYGDSEIHSSIRESDESNGTKAALVFFGLFYDALKDGFTCLIDEMESSLHPILVAKLIEIFNDKRTNPNGAQLIFTTHDISLIENYAEGEVLDRDQIWFAEKNKKGESEFYPLTSVQDMPREGSHIGMKYIHGRYGATPDISLLDVLLELNRDKKN